MSRVNVLGVHIDTLPMHELLAEICANAKDDKRSIIGHANIRALNLAYELDWFRQFLNSCNRVYCDGMGVRIGAYTLREPIPPRFTLADWIWPLAENAARENLGLFFLGNPPGVAKRAAKVLKQRFDALIIETQHGYFDKDLGSPSNQAVIDRINHSKANILLVGFGMPVQERWLLENWSHIQTNVAITCGALFEYIAGDMPRGPHWMTENYFEWLARVFISLIGI